MRPLNWRELTRRRWPRARGASNDARRDLAETINRIGLLMWYTGELSEAEGEYRKALAIQRKLADNNPAVA